MTSVPSSNFTPLRSLYVQVFAPSLGLPSDSARSGTSFALPAPGFASNMTSERPYSRTKFHA